MIINYTTDTDTDTYWFLASEKYLALLVWNRVSGPDYTEIRKRPWHANRVLRFLFLFFIFYETLCNLCNGYIK